MNIYDFDSKDYFVLKLKDGYDSIRGNWYGDVYLSWYDDDFCLSRIYGAMIFNECLYQKELKYGVTSKYKLEYFEKIPIIILDKEDDNEKKRYF